MKSNVDFTRFSQSRAVSNPQKGLALGLSNQISPELNSKSTWELFLLLIRYLRPQAWKGIGSRFKDTSKRLRIVIVSLLVPIALAILKIYLLPSADLLLVFMTSLLFGLITYLLTAWSLKFQLLKSSWLTSVLFPALYAVILVLSMYTFFPEPSLGVGQRVLFVFLAILVSISMYILLLTMNIVNISQFRYIPLVNTAYSALFMVSTVVVFLTFLLNLSLSGEGPGYFAGGLVFSSIVITMSLFTYVYLCMNSWASSWIVSLSLTLTILYSVLVLSFLRITPATISIGAACVTYIGMHMILHHTKMNYKKWFTLEYIFIFFLFAIIVLVDLVGETIIRG